VANTTQYLFHNDSNNIKIIVAFIFRYLESTRNGCEAKSTYLQLIKKIAELHVLNSNHLRVFLEVNPKEVEPLLIEIFDLKQ
jgi:hypothetical protein